MKNFISFLTFILTLFQLTAQPPCLPIAGGILAGDEAPGCSLCGPIYQGSTAGYTPTAPGSDGFPCGTVENNQFISFVADAGGILQTMVITQNCNDSMGIELIIFDENFNAVSNCFTSVTANTPGSVTTQGLVPGETYWIMIDGIDGDICDFLLTVSSGVCLKPPSVPAQLVANPDTTPLCIGAIVCYSIDDVPGATEYEWFSPGNAIVVSGGGTNDTYICLEFISAGGGVVRVTPSNPCFTGIPAITTVVVHPVLPVIKDPEYICGDEFPIFRDGIEFTEFGTYEIIHTTTLNCDSSVTYVFVDGDYIEIPVDTVICEGEVLSIGDSVFSATGHYTAIFQNIDTTRCDTVFLVNLTVIDSSQTLSILCENNQNSVSFSWDDGQVFNRYMLSWDGGDIDTIDSREISISKGQLDTTIDITVAPFFYADCPVGPTTRTFNLNNLPIAGFDYQVQYPTGSSAYLKFTGTADPSAEIIWEISPDPGNWSSSNTGFSIRWLQPGTYQITQTVKDGDCQSTFSRTVFVYRRSMQGSCLPIAGGIPAGDNAPGCTLCGPVYQGSTAGYTSTAPGSDGFPCGTIENNQFLSFTADPAGTLSATILAENCQNNQGVQLIIYDEQFNPVSNCFSSEGANLPGIVKASGLTPGQTYWIMIDGFSGDICDILLTVTGGVNTGPPDPAGPITANPDTTPLCPGTIICYSIDPVNGATHYDWEIPDNAVIISGGSGGINATEVCVEFISAGGGVIRVTPSNPCIVSFPAIDSVLIIPIPPTVKDPEVVCLNNFPILRDGNIFNSHGIHDLNYITALGCDSIVTYSFIPGPEIRTDTFICAGDEIVFADSTLTIQGVYQLFLPNIDSTLCDTSLLVNLIVIDSIQSLDILCENSTDSIKFFWNQNNLFDEFAFSINGGNPDTTNAGEIIIDKTNLDSLVEITVFPISGTDCPVGAAQKSFNLNNLPLAEFTSGGTFCEGDTAVFSFSGTAGSTAEFEWTVHPDPNLIVSNTNRTITLLWSEIGNFELTLTVSEDNCKSVFSDSISILEQIESVNNIKCISDTNRVVFLWDSIPGATDYRVNALKGPQGTLNLSPPTYTVSGLAASEEAIIEVIAASPDFCDSEPVQAACREITCPDLTLEIMPIGPFCKFDQNSPIELTATINDNSGHIQWSGSGVQNGYFSPNLAPQGTNIISAVYFLNNCHFTDTLSVEVWGLPNLDFDLPTHACKDEAVTIILPTDLPDNSDVVWDLDTADIIHSGNDSIIVSWTNEGDKEVSLTVNQSGCISNKTKTISILDKLPDLNIQCTATENRISVTWSSQFADAYQIYLNGNFVREQPFNSIAFPNLLPDTEYEIIVNQIPNIGCPITADTIICRTDKTNATAELDSEYTFTVVPNPTDGTIQIEGNLPFDQIDVFDFSGKKLMQNQTGQIDFTDFPQGIYFLKIETKLGIILKKVIKI